MPPSELTSHLWLFNSCWIRFHSAVNGMEAFFFLPYILKLRILISQQIYNMIKEAWGFFCEHRSIDSWVKTERDPGIDLKMICWVSPRQEQGREKSNAFKVQLKLTPNEIFSVSVYIIQIIYIYRQKTYLEKDSHLMYCLASISSKFLIGSCKIFKLEGFSVLQHQFLLMGRHCDRGHNC